MVSGQIGDPFDGATYTFTGSVGQKILIQNMGSSSSMYAQLYDPQGNSGSSYSYYFDGFYTLTSRVHTGSSSPSRRPGQRAVLAFEVLDLGSASKLQVGTTEADLTVSLSAPSTQQVLVTYATADDTATAPDDYKPAKGEVLFQPGQTMATVEVQAVDRFTSATTDFLVNLSNPVNATIATGQGTGTVTIQPNGGTGATVGGAVFDDTNGDGTLGQGEPGLAGVTIEVLDADNAVVASATSDSQGNYTITDIPAGSYTVAEVLPDGDILTAPAAPGTYAVTLSAGQTFTGLDFGDFRTVTLGGEVYGDTDADGTLGAGESGLAGWTVELLGSSGLVIALTQTGSDGRYTFSGVGPGTYSVQEVLQSGYVQTTAPASYAETTASGQDVGGLDFGLFPQDTLSGEVFADANGNGSLDAGEPGLSGVKVELLGGSGQVIATVTTGSDGTYSFTIDAPGNYSVEEVTPSGATLTTPASGSYVETLASGQAIGGLDFGNFQTVTLSGEVFDDINGDGSLESGEPGLSGWTVNLVNSSNRVIAATTDSSGRYSFAGVGPGKYTVEVVAQSGYVASSATSLSAVRGRRGGSLRPGFRRVRPRHARRRGLRRHQR